MLQEALHASRVQATLRFQPIYKEKSVTTASLSFMTEAPHLGSMVHNYKQRRDDNSKQHKQLNTSSQCTTDEKLNHRSLLHVSSSTAKTFYFILGLPSLASSENVCQIYIYIYIYLYTSVVNLFFCPGMVCSPKKKKVNKHNLV